MPLLKTVTLGCKVNQYETQFVREGLLGAGYREAGPGEQADLCLVNTCTVTAKSDSKSRQLIRRLARDNPAARIVVMGCYATRAAEEVARLPGVVEVVSDKRELPDLLGRFGVVDIPNGISGFGRRHRAYIKVQDGCILGCSYCIIPKVRPQLISRPVDHILDEVRRLLDGGFREIVLTGIHLGHYGLDLNRTRPKDRWVRLSDLVRRIAGMDGDFRVRLSSIEATEVTRRLLDAMGEMGRKVCPHLHVSMQSGSESVLRRMRRRSGARRFLDRCRLACETLDTPALTTDVMVGFPGETDAEFLETCHAAEQIGFSKIHIFPFSPRQGTPAAEMSGQIPHRVKVHRSRHLAAIARELRGDFFESLLGRGLRVLAESPVEGHSQRVVGTSGRYAPVEMPGDAALCGQLVDVTADRVEDGRIHAVA